MFIKIIRHKTILYAGWILQGWTCYFFITMRHNTSPECSRWMSFLFSEWMKISTNTKKRRNEIWLDWCKGGEGTMLFNLFFFISRLLCSHTTWHRQIAFNPIHIIKVEDKTPQKNLLFRLRLTNSLPSNLHLLIHFLWQFFMTFQQFTLHSVSIISSL